MLNPSRNSLQMDDQALIVHNRGRSLLHFASFCHSGKCIVKDRGLNVTREESETPPLAATVHLARAGHSLKVSNRFSP